MNKTALVIGAGDFEKNTGFGRHHVTNLANINEFDKIIITNTSHEKAKKNTTILNSKFIKKKFIPYKLTNSLELEAILNEFKPNFASIVGKSKASSIQDTLHAIYAFKILKNSYDCQVFCEKPFSTIKDSKNILKELLLLTRKQQSRLSMNLPMYFAQNEFSKYDFLQYQNINSINIHWSSNPQNPQMTVLDDLILHTWSIIPNKFEITSRKLLKNSKRYFEIDLELKNKNKIIPCNIKLQYGNDERSININKKHQIYVKPADIFELDGKELFKLNNPLRMGLENAITRNPLVNYEVIIASQKFLCEFK